jgi:hypothetical protein
MTPATSKYVARAPWVALTIGLAAAAFAIGTLIRRPQTDWSIPTMPQHTIYCDGATHQQPFIPAEQCGGIDSCMRMVQNHMQPTPCPTR